MSALLTDAPTVIAETSPTGAELPGWLETRGELLDAVMSYPAPLIAMGLAATGTTHLPTLLDYLTKGR